MEMNELIAMITKQVKQRLEAAESKKRVLLVESSSSPCFKSCCGLLEDDSFKISDIEEYKTGENLDSYDLVVVPNLSIKQLSDTALGIVGGSCQKVMIESILKGKKAYIIEEGIEYRKYKAVCPEGFYNMLAEYEARLASFGICIIKSSELQNAIMAGENSNCAVCSGEKPLETGKSIKLDKKIITETDIQKLSRQGFNEIIAGKRTIVTPLALDSIKINNIRLIKE